MTEPHATRSRDVARLRGFLERDPENWSLRADLFDAALVDGDRALAREQVEHALRRLPSDPGWHHRHAVLLLAENRYADAEAILTALLDAGQDHPAVRHNLAFARFGQGRWDAARETAEPLLDVAGDPGADAALVLWIRCHHRLGSLAVALDRFRALASQRPVPAAAWGAASLMALDEGALQEAKGWSDRAIAHEPEQMEALATRGTLLLGALDAAGAREWFEKALAQNPADGRSWSGLAFARMVSGDLAGAAVAFEQAVRYFAEHVGTWVGQGWCAVLMNRPAEARDAFARAVELDRTNAEAHGGLAVALARLGQAAEGRRAMEVARRLDRNGLSARYAEALLSGRADDSSVPLQVAREVLERSPFPVVGWPTASAATTPPADDRGRRRS